MTAMEAFERVEQLRKFIELLDDLYVKHSHWNEELGEGNPDAISITEMKSEYYEELKGLTDHLSNIVID